MLDTRTSDAAKFLYHSLGYQLIGIIPDYAFPTVGRLADISFMYKKIT